MTIQLGEINLFDYIKSEGASVSEYMLNTFLEDLITYINEHIYLLKEQKIRSYDKILFYFKQNI